MVCTIRQCIVNWSKCEPGLEIKILFPIQQFSPAYQMWLNKWLDISSVCFMNVFNNLPTLSLGKINCGEVNVLHNYWLIRDKYEKDKHKRNDGVHVYYSKLLCKNFSILKRLPTMKARHKASMCQLILNSVVKFLRTKDLSVTVFVISLYCNLHFSSLLYD